MKRIGRGMQRHQEQVAAEESEAAKKAAVDSINEAKKTTEADAVAAETAATEADKANEAADADAAKAKADAKKPAKQVANKAARGLPTTGSAGSLPITELAQLGLVAPTIAVAVKRRNK